MKLLTIVALRVLLILLFLGAVLAQTAIIPVLAAQEAARWPEVAHLAAPYATLVISAIACAEVALVALWMLLSMVSRGAIFTERAFRWVDVIIYAALAATVLTIAAPAHLLGAVGVGGPGVVLVLGTAAIAGASFVLLMLVMRGLLRTATTLESELAEVV